MELQNNVNSVTFKDIQLKFVPETANDGIEPSTEEQTCNSLTINSRDTKGFSYVLNMDILPYSSANKENPSPECIPPVSNCSEDRVAFQQNTESSDGDSDDTINCNNAVQSPSCASPHEETECNSHDRYDNSETSNTVLVLYENSPPGVQASPECNEFEPSREFSYLDARRTRRTCKRKKDSDLFCPICGLTVRLPELESHFAQEVEKLGKIPKSLKKPPQDASGVNTSYVQVKSNRQNRLTAKVATYAAKATKEIQCPVCYLKISGAEEDVNKHVALCVQNEDSSDEFINVDSMDTNSYEEYEFGDQTRVRAVSFIPGGHRALEGQTARRTHADEDEDLDVDVDDTMAYGQPQYTELDVISNHTQSDETRDQLRKAVLVDPTVQPLILESRKWSESTVPDCKEDINETIENSKMSQEKDALPTVTEVDATSDQIVSTLKEKIKDLEDQCRNIRCLICMESYTKPVVSTTCWHVYCEECWLMTMGVKKLCPQCNMIVFPSDLRKIYL